MILDFLINKLIAANYNSNTNLGVLDSKIIAIQCAEFAKHTLYLHCESDRLHTSFNKPKQIDCLISASLEDYVGLFLKQQAKLNIDGDVELAAALKKLVLTIDIDFEEQLAIYIGDIAAPKISRGVTTIATSCINSVKDFMQMGMEYMQYESNILPSKKEFGDYKQEVHELRLALDRLQARRQANADV